MPLDSSRTAPSLRFAWLEITNRCNLECHHCYAESGPLESASGRMELVDWFATMDQLRELGCSRIQFIGGEPTLHPRFVDLVTYARRAGFETIEIYTNATRLSPRLCSLLAAQRVEIAVSFYSAKPAVHDRITGRIGSFERTVNGIQEALRHGLPVRVGLIAMEENKDELEEARSYVEVLGVTSVAIDRERGIGRAAARLPVGPPLEQLCGACGTERIAVNADGDVSPCVFSHFHPLGNVRAGLHEILGRNELETFRQKLRRNTSGDCSPGCGPHQCNPGDSPGPCFPSDCDPSICNPQACAPRD